MLEFNREHNIADVGSESTEPRKRISASKTRCTSDFSAASAIRFVIKDSTGTARARSQLTDKRLAGI